MGGCKDIFENGIGGRVGVEVGFLCQDRDEVIKAEGRIS